MRDAGICRQQAVDIGGGGRYIFRCFKHRYFAAHHLDQLGHAFAVSTVDQHQHVAVARQQGIDGGFNRERTAALHRHADMGFLGVGNIEQHAAHVGGNRIERGIP